MCTGFHGGNIPYEFYIVFSVIHLSLYSLCYLVPHFNLILISIIHFNSDTNVLYHSSLERLPQWQIAIPDLYWYSKFITHMRRFKANSHRSKKTFNVCLPESGQPHSDWLSSKHSFEQPLNKNKIWTTNHLNPDTLVPY